MLSGSNRIYGRHMIVHNDKGQFAQYDVLEIFKDFVVQGQGLNWSSRDKD